MDTIEYATFCYDTVEVENGLKEWKRCEQHEPRQAGTAWLRRDVTESYQGSDDRSQRYSQFFQDLVAFLSKFDNRVNRE